MTNKEAKVYYLQILQYEIVSSWWAWLIWFGWGHDLAGKYYAWKVGRKLTRFAKHVKLTNNFMAG